MPLRLKRYSASLVTLGILCAVYQFTFVLWLQPETLLPIEFAGTRVVAHSASMSAIYPKDAWQLGNCKRLQTRDGALLFENWEQIGDDQWKLWPLSVVLGMNSETPLVIDAPEGAEIKFAESLDMLSGGAPPIERGRMIGQVRIRSVGKAFAMGDTGDQDSLSTEGHLEIVSSDFGIDFRKIWTTQPIVVKIGDIRLAGRDLTLHLAPMGRIQSGGEAPLSILNRLELIYLDDLTVPLPEGGLWRSGPAAKLADQSATRVPLAPPVRRLPVPGAEAPPPAMAKLRCAGRVVFQFSTNELALENRVVLEHRTDEAIDIFECTTLRMRFADLLNRRPAVAPDDPLARFLVDSQSVTGGGKPEQSIDDFLISVVAEGTPARMRLPSFAADVSAEKIDFDARAGLLQMSGIGGARITYGGHTWRFKNFTYQLNPTDPKKIGTFDAMGSGLVEFAGPTELPIRRLRWADGIQLSQPDPSGQFTIRVDGSVSALMNDEGEFNCDSAMLVLQAGDEALEGDQWLQATKPVRFQATGQVSIQSPMVNVATRLLRLYFDFDETAKSISPDAGSVTADGNSVAAHPLRRWVRQPSDDGKQIGEGGVNADGTPAIVVGAATPVQGPRPMIHGDTINAKLRLSGRELTASDLTVVGNVTLRHMLETAAGAIPAVLTGQRLQLRDTQGDEILQIGSGIDSPARLSVGDGFFIGPLIQVRLADNLVWIKDAGEFQVPSQMLPQTIATKPDFSPIDDSIAGPQAPKTRPPTNVSSMKWVSPPRCRWRGQMMFDGSRVVLTDGVDIRGAVMAGKEQDVWDIDLIGDQLQVVLSGEVRMRDPESMRSATIDQVNITSSKSHPLVITVNQLSGVGVRKGRHVLTVPELTMRPETSQLSGVGAGWYRAWIKNERGGLASTVTSGGFRPSEPTMTGVHLVFKESLQANMNLQSLDFLRAVRIASREVKSWDDVIDVEAIQGLRQGESTLDCDRLRLAIDQTQPPGLDSPPWEMEAIGNVVYHTRNERGLYNGVAERAAYTAAKDQFLIEGQPGRSATMNQTLPTGAAGTNAAVKRLSVNTRTMEVINVEFDRLQLGPLPNFAKDKK
ncbi:MAG TPA: hypothetical protein DDZ51_19580 [Planctomycetaceae bacterium]|nr:hypothetical protein [Planctomycetaceae bacterium]